ncbi:hypothetical protein RSOLAG22IIIB_08257 [Rhizoctonia solani]|uniref:SnoaL-like domain-containing protein n=1 Tax=Rhizoctonia solani TaxID=456999 RepID=A0A0K6FRW9_9AGAM|nr:hypothetical protein RSOLAG22IIIB_08257 [Rhizoctonia solani]
MDLPTSQISAPGLTEQQVLDERAWLDGYAKALDSLDWAKWEGRWTEDAFLQFGNLPRIQGKEAIATFHEQMFGAFEYLHHNFTRYSFDVPLELIYQTTIVTFRVKSDPEKRDIQVPGMSVIHKKTGENQATGCEIYVDSSPVMAVVQEIFNRNTVDS